MEDVFDVCTIMQDQQEQIQNYGYILNDYELLLPKDESSFLMKTLTSCMFATLGSSSIRHVKLQRRR